MAKINLLPWREELRTQQQKDFIVGIGAGVVVTCIIFSLVYMQIEMMKEYQEGRNRLINNEIKQVNKKIKEIKDIEAKKRKLLTKIEVIQKLQQSRPQIVHLFEELATRTPEGIFLTSFKQNGKSLSFNGKAESNARVSAYMRGVDASKWFRSPVLKVIQGRTKAQSGQLSDFTMVATQGGKKPKKEKNKSKRKRGKK